ncbi:flavin-containing monooxygenase [Alkalihalobacillus pseudalcaliphilus]|uniref:flavin-containing monooxygenase n=1 Tax=Alkalihalobacillus pseudalcaliphilus TaxID=79884 RepID=UPI00064DE7A1|nr:NAD(P)-binding domain-containing protein [Alkalihalobacillus pseudalcaliphilus]KMK77523.1 oxidoreductase [Alkalihalobacillus pseudalcaliphilus]
MLYDVIIVGAGQAGIAVSQKLKKENIKHLMIDSSERVGDQWRARYHSLVLFTPRDYSSLPDLKMKGKNNTYPTKDEVADYLEQYVEHFNLPIALGIQVTLIEKEKNMFLLHTSNGVYQSKKVVIASGAFKDPFIPLSLQGSQIKHIHSSGYKNINDIKGKKVLIVGGGNSGVQIASELALTKEVYLAVSQKIKYMPLTLFNKSIFYWINKLKFLHAGKDTIKGKIMQKRQDPIFGYESKVLINKGKIKVKPRVDQLINNKVIFSDKSELEIDTILWCTGFKSDYNWLRIEGALTSEGLPLHKRGISPVENLFFIGLPWQYQRGSSLICGVGLDAAHLVNNMMS